MKEKIGKKLKEIRLGKKITRKSLARQLNFNIETLKKYEDGSILIPIDKLKKIVNFYNIPLYLFFLEIEINSKLGNNKELLLLKNFLESEAIKIKDFLE